MSHCLTSFVEFCQPYELPAHWSFVDTDPQAFLRPDDPAAALAQLVKLHSSDDIVAAGLAERDGENKLRPSAAFEAPERLIVALRRAASGEVFNVLTSSGCVRPGSLPLFAIREDAHTVDSLAASRKRLLMTESLADTVLFRSLGLPAAPVNGVASLGADGVRLLEQHFGIRRASRLRQEAEEEQEEDEVEEEEEREGDEDAGTTGAQPPTSKVSPVKMNGVILVGFDVQSLLAGWTPELIRAGRHFLDLESHVCLGLSRVTSWTPREKNLADLEFCLRRREQEWLREAMLASLADDVAGLRLHDVAPSVPPPPLNLAAAIEELSNSRLRPASEYMSRQRRLKARENFRRVAIKELVRPIAQEFAEHDDPQERARGMVVVSQLMAWIDMVANTTPDDLGAVAGEPVDAGNAKQMRHFLLVCEQLTTQLGGPRPWPRSSAGRLLPRPRSIVLNAPSRSLALPPTS